MSDYKMIWDEDHGCWKSWDLEGAEWVDDSLNNKEEEDETNIRK